MNCMLLNRPDLVVPDVTTTSSISNVTVITN